MTSPNITDAHVPKLNNKGEPTRNDMTEHEVIKRDAIRLAAVVVNLSKEVQTIPREGSRSRLQSTQHQTTIGPGARLPRASNRLRKASGTRT
jgi:hypothetical protein